MEINIVLFLTGKLYAKKPKFSGSVPAAAAAIVASFGPTTAVFALPEGLTVGKVKLQLKL